MQKRNVNKRRRENESVWITRNQVYADLFKIQELKCGKITFRVGSESNYFVALMSIFNLYRNDLTLTPPDQIILNDKRVDLKYVSVYKDVDIQLFSELGVTTLVMQHKKLVVYPRENLYTSVSLVWTPSRSQVYDLLLELDLFDEINLIDVVLNYLTFVRF